MLGERAVREIVGYMEERFGPVQKDALVERVPISGIGVHVVPPTEDLFVTTLFTVGMSARPMKVPKGSERFRHAELLMHLPGDWPLPSLKGGDDETLWPFLWLKRLALFPHENATWLAPPCTIIANGEPPEPLGPGTKLSCLMLLHDADLECADGRLVRFHSVFPLYTEERDLERAQGLPALLKLFQKHEVAEVVEVDRVNVGKRR